MATEIRPARPADAPFLAWVALAAARSHVARGAWDLAVPASEEERLAFLQRLLLQDEPHWCHHGGFLVAEVDGRPAAALSGYGEGDASLLSPGTAIERAGRAGGWSDRDLAAAFQRLAVFMSCTTGDVPGAWIVEWVATRPEFRRMGLVRELLAAILEEGRRRGHETAQLTILIGNTSAQRAYERAGFVFDSEKRSPEFEAAVGCPGLSRGVRSL